jgi:hypothetical protein
MSNVAHSRFVRRLILAILVAQFLLTGVLVFPLLDSAPTDRAVAALGTGGAGPGNASASFMIEGNATGSISPGALSPLDLKITNPHDVSLSITDLTVTVQKVSAPNADNAHRCSIGDFSVGQVSRGIAITIGAGASSTLSSLGVPRSTFPTVGMLERSVNQDGCKGALLTLGYSAFGTLAVS